MRVIAAISRLRSTTTIYWFLHLIAWFLKLNITYHFLAFSNFCSLIAVDADTGRTADGWHVVSTYKGAENNYTHPHPSPSSVTSIPTNTCSYQLMNIFKLNRDRCPNLRSHGNLSLHSSFACERSGRWIHFLLQVRHIRVKYRRYPYNFSTWP